MTLGTKLLQLRDHKGLTREGLALEINVSKVAYGRWESDISKPKMENLIHLCEFHNISLNELLKGVSNINYKGILRVSHCNSTESDLSPNDFDTVISELLSNQQKMIDLLLKEKKLIGRLLDARSKC